MKSDTLKERIRHFSKVYDEAHFLSREQLLEDFINQELKVYSNQIVITKKDLNAMQDHAISAWQELPTQSSYQGNNKLMLAYVWTCSVLHYLRRYNLLHSKIDVDKGT